MALIQRYLFRQLLTPTLATTAALGGVAVLSQSLSLLNLVVAERQAAWTFLKLVLLSIPGLLAFIIPITCLIATLFSLNKLHTEQEIVVCQASGMSRWQVTSPSLRVAAFASLLMLAINLWISPACNRVAREELFKARTDLAGSLVKEGQFTDSANGLTVYAQRTDARGVLHNLFVYQPKSAGVSSTFDAQQGIITHRNGTPVLIMQHGSNEEFSPAGTLNYLDFEEYVFDLTPYIDTKDVLGYKPSDMFMHELVFPDRGQAFAPKLMKKMTSEANARLAAVLYIPAFVLLAVYAVIGGAFSRMGYARQIAGVAAMALVIRLLGVSAQAACETTPWLNPLQYIIPLVPGTWASWRLFHQRAVAPRAARRLEGLTPIGA